MAAFFVEHDLNHIDVNEFTWELRGEQSQHLDRLIYANGESLSEQCAGLLDCWCRPSRTLDPAGKPPRTRST